MKKQIAVVAAVVAMSSSAQAAVEVFRDGYNNTYVSTWYNGTNDTTFDSASDAGGGYNNGNAGGAYYFGSNQSRTWEEWRSLISFDLSVLTNQVTVNTATLRLAVIANSSPNDIALDFYSINSANAGWVEGINGSLASAGNEGESTWNHKVKSSTSPVEWVGGAGLMTAGVAYDASAVAFATYPSAAEDGAYLDITLPASLVQAWIDNPTGNAGLLMLTDAEDGNYYRFANFYSAQADTAIYRPALILDVSPVPEPASLGVTMLIAGGLLARRRARA